LDCGGQSLSGGLRENPKSVMEPYDALKPCVLGQGGGQTFNDDSFFLGEEKKENISLLKCS
jgi:hypothetical protein